MDGQNLQSPTRAWIASTALLLTIYVLSRGPANGRYTYHPASLPFGVMDEWAAWMSTFYLPMDRLAATETWGPMLVNYLRWCRGMQGNETRFEPTLRTKTRKIPL